jgi:integrase
MASIRPRGNSWVFDRGIQGKGRMKTFATKEDAQKALDEYEAKRTLGLDINKPLPKQLASTCTVSEAIVKYMSVVNGNRDADGLKLDQRFFDQLYHWLYDQSIFYIDQVEPIHMEGYQAELMKNYKPSSVNRMFQVYKPFFKTMLRWDLVAKNPTLYIKVLAVEPKRKKIWPKELIDQFEAQLPLWARPVIKFMAQTGCRPGQIAKAKFGDLDYDKKEFKTFSNKGGRKKKPTIPINREAMAIVLEQRSKLRFRNSHDHLVFPGPSGETFGSDYLYTVVRRVQKRLNMDGYCPYGLRTTYGTRKVKERVHLKVIAELMGHSDTRTTEGYVGDISSEARSAVENDSWLTKTS